jgi:hypothetical protein
MGITLMQPRMTRPFRISDALVLVAATGIGLAGCGLWLTSSGDASGDLWPRGEKSVLAAVWIAGSRAIPVLSILLLSWTTAVLLLRLRANRPRRRHLWCQPGFLACVAALLAFAWETIGIGLFLVAELLTVSPDPIFKFNYWDAFGVLAFGYLASPASAAGGAVLLVWLVTWASGRCRPEPSSIDRMGRALGAAWVCISLMAFFGRLW